MTGRSEREVLEERLLAVTQSKDSKTTKKSKGGKKEKVAEGKENKTRTRSATKKEAEKEPEGKGKKPKVKKERKTAAMQWAKKENHHHTDRLLTIIEDTNRYKQAFGFANGGADSGGSKTVSSSGQRPNDMCMEIARKLWVDVEEPLYEEVDVPNLGSVIKNRVTTIKALFREIRDALGTTGMGLIEANKESEIEKGTPMANVWENAQEKFPWFKRLIPLYGKSPIVDRSGVANSKTSVNVDALQPHVQKDASSASESEDSDIEVISKSGNKSDGSDDEDDDPSASSPAKAPARTTQPAPTPLAQRGIKRKGVVLDGDAVRHAVEATATQRTAVTTIKEKEKTQHETKKMKLKHDLELRRIQVKQEEAERDRAHQMAMLDRQIRLEELRARSFAPHHPPGPSMVHQASAPFPSDPPGFAGPYDTYRP